MFAIGDLSAMFGRLFGKRKPTGKPAWGRQTPIELLALTLARNPEGWLIEPHRILRNGVEISWQGPFTTTTSVTVRMDGKKYPVMSSEVLVLKEALQALLANRAAVRRKGDIVFPGGIAKGRAGDGEPDEGAIDAASRPGAGSDVHHPRTP